MSRIARILLALSLLVGTVLVGAAPASVAATTIPTYHLSDSGRTVSILKGTEIRFSLRTNVDGGFRWAVTTRPDPTKLQFISKKLVPYSHPAGTVGFPYHTYYLFKGIGRGKTTIKIKERQPFNTSNVIRVFVLTIIIR